MPDNSQQTTHDILLDTSGLNCPEPVMMLHQAIRKAQAGQVIKVLATDPSTTRDIPKFCMHLGHGLLSETQQQVGGKTQYLFEVKKKA